ncbi:MAG: ParB/RepB/Spo0J family partition protein [Leptospiraceae bacterium]|nr:ParB/RepB/Spo0J family partition protein [Leptospiraceae bacterium]MCP5493169.1 ParB/RepB/Spo0J family partition protein [Leptospiraceae bacterium]
MNKQKALGRGLNNLIPINSKSESSTDDVQPENENYREIKVSDIKFNPSQPRKSISPESISELAETIKLHGVIQPVVVMKKNGHYELVSGERRVRACLQAGFQKVPAIIKKYSEEESLEVALIENIQREDLNPIEEAATYQILTEKLSLKITELAERVGKNRTTISNLIRLLQLPEPVQKLLKERKLSEGHARPLLSIGDKKKLESVANMIVEKSLSVREVEDYVAKLLDSDSEIASKARKVDPSIAQIETKIRNKFSVRVNVSHNQKTGKGKIILNYSSLEEMDKILENMDIQN